MLKTSVLALFPIIVFALTACTAAAPDGEVDLEAVVPDAVEPTGGQVPVTPCCGTPAQTVNLRPYAQVIVRLPGYAPALIVAANTNVNLPCATTTVYFDLIYTNGGN